MNAQRLLIADPSDEFRAALAEILSDQFTIQSAKNGEDAFLLAQSFLPDILLLDLMLPEIDGLTLLQRFADQNIHPAILVTTLIYSEYVINALANLGVSYMIPKPCQASAVAERVRELGSLPPLPSSLPRESLDEILLRLGFSRKLSGTRYLQQAIRLFAKDPQQMLTKELYTGVGQLFHASSSQVERAIRNAIASAWSSRDDRIWLRFFPTGENGMVRRPTNGELITRLSEFISHPAAA